MRRLIFIAILLLIAGSAYAKDLRAEKIERFLARYCPTSPLHGRGQEIVRSADHYNLDYRLYLAIAGAESTWGKNPPKRSRYNFTGISNGGAVFRSISHNIKFTHETIATKKWYRRYRKTGKLMDLVYVYKGVPPYDRYNRALRFTMEIVTAMAVPEVKPTVMAKVDLSWNSIRYDKFDIRKTIFVD
jgi:hypothetical protein